MEYWNTHPGSEVFWTWWNLAWDRINTDRMSERLNTNDQYDLDAIMPIDRHVHRAWNQNRHQWQKEGQRYRTTEGLSGA